MQDVVVRFQPDAESMPAYHELMVEMTKFEFPDGPMPTLEGVTARLQNSLKADQPAEYFAVWTGERLDGILLAIYPGQERSGIVDVDVRVRPSRRREGIGTMLLRHYLTRASQHGRGIVQTVGLTEGSPSTEWTDKLRCGVSHRDLLMTVKVTSEATARWDPSPPPGYRLLKWIGTTPDELLESYAAARWAIHDAPLGEAYRLAEFSPARIREAEDLYRKRGVVQHIVIAIHEKSGTVVGVTELHMLEGRPDAGFTQETAVLSQYRTHGLGFALKSEMLLWLSRTYPALTEVYTTTSNRNTAMESLNKRLGFEVTRSVVTVEASVSSLIDELNGAD